MRPPRARSKVRSRPACRPRPSFRRESAPCTSHPITAARKTTGLRCAARSPRSPGRPVDRPPRLPRNSMKPSTCPCLVPILFTRNAVTGWLWRKGLRGSDRAAPRKRRPPAPRKMPQAPRTLYADDEPVAPLPAPDDAVNDAPGAAGEPSQQSRGCSLLELTGTRCHWPVGDPRAADFYFCGVRTDGAIYCGTHGRLAYQPPASCVDRRPSRG